MDTFNILMQQNEDGIINSKLHHCVFVNIGVWSGIYRYLLAISTTAECQL